MIASHVVTYQSYAAPEASLCFPCDECGRVALDALSDGERRDYLFARAVVGVRFARPTVSLRSVRATTHRPASSVAGQDRSH